MTCLAFIISALSALALDRQDKTIPLTASVQESPAEISLTWTAPTSGSYVITHQKIYRRLPGQAWGPEHAVLATTALSFTDTAVQVEDRRR